METEENINGGEVISESNPEIESIRQRIKDLEKRSEVVVEGMKAGNGNTKSGLDAIEPGADEFVKEVDDTEPVLESAEAAADDQLIRLAIQEAEERAQ